MKKTILTLVAFMLLGLTVKATSKDSVTVVQLVDEMTDDVTLVASRKMVVANESKTIGLIFYQLIDKNGLSTLLVTALGLGGCHEKDEMIILFENGEKVTLNSWKKFNCKGESYFELTDKVLELLKTQPIKKIRLMNGYSFDSYTFTVEPRNKRYYIQLLQSI